MSEEESVCNLGQGDVVIDHETVNPLARIGANPGEQGFVGKLKKLVRRAVQPCAVPGVSLTDYRLGPSGKGWGAPCTGSRTTVTLSNGVRLTVRSEIAELVTLIMNANIAQGYAYRQVDTGAYNCRYISGTTIWSNHAWGLAIDENWQSNPMRRPLTTDKPEWLRARWNRYGFAWGGDYVYPSTPDAMHFEFMGTPDQARLATDLARAELGGGAPVVNPVPAPAPGIPYSDQAKIDQTNLNDTGFPCGTPDGYWGPASVTACKAFQQAAGLYVDGICGPATRAALAKVPSWRGNPFGDGGYSALRWQQKLAEHGWHIETDGVWGSHSASIMQQYQHDKGLPHQDGIRNAESWTSLYCTVN